MVARIGGNSKNVSVSYLCLLVLVAGCKPAESSREVPAAVIASCTGGMNFNTGWELSINASGQASLSIGVGASERVEFVVSEEDLTTLRRVLAPHMSYLAENRHISIGNSSPDEVVRTLIVVWRNKMIAITFHDLSEFRD